MKEKKDDVLSFRCPPGLTEVIKRNANVANNDLGPFIRRCMEEICSMMDDPDKNDVPEMVAIVRYAKVAKNNPIPLNKPRKTA